MLTVTDLTVAYGAIAAVRGVSLTIEKGELVALLGANGAGKTSTLNAIMGFVPHEAEALTFNGTSISALPVEARPDMGIAYSPEGRRVFKSMTVHENLRAGGNQLKGQVLHDRIEHVVQRFPVLKERFTQIAGSLSGGEQQMLAIARALMLEPQFLILDEPSLGLAPKIVSEVFGMIDELHQDGITILLVEQNVRKSLAIADRGYVMELGNIRQSGDAETLRNDPEIINAYLGHA